MPDTFLCAELLGSNLESTGKQYFLNACDLYYFCDLWYEGDKKGKGFSVDSLEGM